jgi:hypothetical protein
MDKTNPRIHILRHLICEASGVKGTLHDDYVKIKVFVEKQTQETVDIPDIKHFFQYGGSSNKPQLSTLDIFSKTVGYQSYDDFCKHFLEQLQTPRIHS